MPQWLQNVAKITPHAWANSAFNKLMLFGASPTNVMPEMIALTLFGVVFLSDPGHCWCPGSLNFPATPTRAELSG